MGALCGKEAQDSDPFSHPGRTVGSAPASQTRASVPKTTDKGQTLGNSKSGNSVGNDPRSAAAKAAEVGQPQPELASRFKKYPSPWAVMRL